MRKAVIAILFPLFACSAIGPAEARAYRSSNGQVFDLSCNANGFVMVARGSGERMFFGVRGDAMSPGIGSGSWCAANGGFGATIGSRSVFFPRQEPFCPGAGYVTYGPICGQ